MFRVRGLGPPLGSLALGLPTVLDTLATALRAEDLAAIPLRHSLPTLGAGDLAWIAVIGRHNIVLHQEDDSFRHECRARVRAYA